MNYRQINAPREIMAMTNLPDMNLLVTAADNPELITVPAVKDIFSLPSIRSAWQRVPWTRIGLFRVSLFLFILAITLMKEGLVRMEEV